MSASELAEYPRLNLAALLPLACALVLGATACADKKPADGSAASSNAETIRSIYQALDGNEVLLDARSSDGKMVTIAGIRESARPGTDALRSIVLTEVPDELASLSDRRVLDAQFVGEGAVVLGTDRVLSYYDATGARQLAKGVLGPLSAAAGRVAFVHGEPPDLHLAVVDLDDPTPQALAASLTTVWSPALSPDGREVIVTASHRGRPGLFRIDAANEVHPLADVGAIPSSPTAPIWQDGYLTFEDDELGVVRIDLATNELEEHIAEATLLPDDGSGKVRISVDGRIQTLGKPEGGAR